MEKFYNYNELKGLTKEVMDKSDSMSLSGDIDTDIHAIEVKLENMNQKERLSRGSTTKKLREQLETLREIKNNKAKLDPILKQVSSLTGEAKYKTIGEAANADLKLTPYGLLTKYRLIDSNDMNSYIQKIKLRNGEEVDIMNPKTRGVISGFLIEKCAKGELSVKEAKEMHNDIADQFKNSNKNNIEKILKEGITYSSAQFEMGMKNYITYKRTEQFYKYYIDNKDLAEKYLTGTLNEEQAKTFTEQEYKKFKGITGSINPLSLKILDMYEKRNGSVSDKITSGDKGLEFLVNIYQSVGDFANKNKTEEGGLKKVTIGQFKESLKGSDMTTVNEFFDELKMEGYRDNEMFDDGFIDYIKTSSLMATYFYQRKLKKFEVDSDGNALREKNFGKFTSSDPEIKCSAIFIPTTRDFTKTLEDFTAITESFNKQAYGTISDMNFFNEISEYCNYFRYENRLKENEEFKQHNKDKQIKFEDYPVYFRTIASNLYISLSGLVFPTITEPQAKFLKETESAIAAGLSTTVSINIPVGHGKTHSLNLLKASLDPNYKDSQGNTDRTFLDGKKSGFWAKGSLAKTSPIFKVPYVNFIDLPLVKIANIANPKDLKVMMDTEFNKAAQAFKEMDTTKGTIVLNLDEYYQLPISLREIIRNYIIDFSLKPQNKDISVVSCKIGATPNLLLEEIKGDVTKVGGVNASVKSARETFEKYLGEDYKNENLKINIPKKSKLFEDNILIGSSSYLEQAMHDLESKNNARIQLIVPSIGTDIFKDVFSENNLIKLSQETGVKKFSWFDEKGAKHLARIKQGGATGIYEIEYYAVDQLKTEKQFNEIQEPVAMIYTKNNFVGGDFDSLSRAVDASIVLLDKYDYIDSSFYQQMNGRNRNEESQRGTGKVPPKKYIDYPTTEKNNLIKDLANREKAVNWIDAMQEIRGNIKLTIIRKLFDPSAPDREKKADFIVDFMMGVQNSYSSTKELLEKFGMNIEALKEFSDEVKILEELKKKLPIKEIEGLREATSRTGMFEEIEKELKDISDKIEVNALKIEIKKLKFEKINLANARFYLEAMLLQKQLLNSISILKDVKKIDENNPSSKIVLEKIKAQIEHYTATLKRFGDIEKSISGKYSEKNPKYLEDYKKQTLTLEKGGTKISELKFSDFSEQARMLYPDKRVIKDEKGNLQFLFGGQRAEEIDKFFGMDISKHPAAGIDFQEQIEKLKQQLEEAERKAGQVSLEEKQNLDAEIARLKKELDSANNQKTTAENEKNALTEELKKTKEEFDKLQKDIKEKEKSLKALGKEKDEVDKNLQKAQNEKSKLETERDKLGAANKALEAQVANSGQNADQKDKTIAANAEKITGLEQEISKKNSEIDGLKSSKTKIETDLSSATQDLKEKKAELNKLKVEEKKKRDELKAQIKKLAGEFGNKKTSFFEQASALAEALKELANIQLAKKEIKELSDSLEAFKTGIAAKEREISDLDNKLKQNETDQKNLQAQLTDQQKASGDESAQLQAQLDSLKKSQVSLGAEKTKLETSIAELKKTHEAEVNKLKVENKKLKNHRSAKEKELQDELDKTKSQNDQKIDQLTQEKASLETEKTKLSESVNNLTKEKGVLEKQKTDLESEKSALEKKILELKKLSDSQFDIIWSYIVQYNSQTSSSKSKRKSGSQGSQVDMSRVSVTINKTTKEWSREEAEHEIEKAVSLSSVLNTKFGLDSNVISDLLGQVAKLKAAEKKLEAEKSKAEEDAKRAKDAKIAAEKEAADNNLGMFNSIRGRLSEFGLVADKIPKTIEEISRYNFKTESNNLMESIVKKYKDVNDNFNKKQAELNNKLTDLTNLNGSIDKLRKDLSEKEEKNSQEQRQLRNELVQKDKELKKKEAEFKKLQTEQKELDEKIKEMAKTLDINISKSRSKTLSDAVLTKFAETQAILSMAGDTNDGIKVKYTGLQNEMSDVKIKHKKELDSINNEKQDLSETISDLTEALKTTKDELAQSIKKQNKAEEDLRFFVLKTMYELTEDKQSISGDSEDEKLKNFIEDKKNIRLEEVGGLYQQVFSAMIKANKDTTDLKNLRDEFDKKIQEVSDLEAKIKSLESDISADKDALQVLQAKEDRLKQAHQKEKDDLTQKFNDDIKEKVDEIVKVLNDSKLEEIAQLFSDKSYGDLGGFKEKVDDLLKDLKDLREQLGDDETGLSAKIDAKTKELRDADVGLRTFLSNQGVEKGEADNIIKTIFSNNKKEIEKIIADKGLNYKLIKDQADIIETLKAELLDYKTKEANLKTEAKKIQKDILDKANKALSQGEDDSDSDSDNEETNADISISETLAILKNRVGFLEGENDKLKTEVQEKENQIQANGDDKDGIINQKEGEINALKQEITNNEAIINSLKTAQADIDALKKQKEDIETRLVGKNNEVDKLTNDLNSLQQQLIQQASQAVQPAGDDDKIVEDAQTDAPNVDGGKDALDKVKAELNQVKQELTEKDDEITATSKKLTEANEELGRKDDEIAKKDKEIDDLKKISKVGVDINKTKEVIDDMVEAIKNIKEEIAIKEKDNKENATDNSDEIRDLKDQLIKAIRDLEQYRQQAERATKDLQAEKERNKDELEKKSKLAVTTALEEAGKSEEEIENIVDAVGDTLKATDEKDNLKSADAFVFGVGKVVKDNNLLSLSDEEKDNLRAMQEINIDLEKKAKEWEKLSDEIRSERAKEIEALKVEIDSLKKKLEEVEAGTDEANALTDELKEKEGRLNGLNAAQEKALQDASKESKKKIIELEKKLSSIKKFFESTLRENKVSEDKIREFNDQLANAKNSSDIKTIIQKVFGDSSTREAENLKNELQVKADEYKNIENQLNDERKKLENVEKERDGLLSKVEDLEAQLKNSDGVNLSGSSSIPVFYSAIFTSNGLSGLFSAKDSLYGEFRKASEVKGEANVFTSDTGKNLVSSIEKKVSSIANTSESEKEIFGVTSSIVSKSEDGKSVLSIVQIGDINPSSYIEIFFDEGNSLRFYNVDKTETNKYGLEVREVSSDKLEIGITLDYFKDKYGSSIILTPREILHLSIEKYEEPRLQKKTTLTADSVSNDGVSINLGGEVVDVTKNQEGTRENVKKLEEKRKLSENDLTPAPSA